MVFKEVVLLLKNLLLLACILFSLFLLNDNAIGQVTVVSPFSDVGPQDWAFQSLASLTARYGCVMGYNDNSFRGDRAITRYELVDILGSCLDGLDKTIQNLKSDELLNKDLQKKLKDLSEISSLESTAAGDRLVQQNKIEALESKLARLENQESKN